MRLVAFLASDAGRALRVVVGLALLALGPTLVGGSLGVVMTVVGLVPLIAGIFDLCLVAALFGYPVRGPEIRARIMARRLGTRKG